MLKYVYKTKEYLTPKEVRQAIFKSERKALPSEPVENKVEFWNVFGVECVTQAPQIETEAEKAKKEINKLKAKLKSRDYIGVKIATGCATVEDYAKEIEECERWRNRINELEVMIENAQ